MKDFKSYTKKIFCIEGDWESDLRNKKSIIGILDFLHNVMNLDYIHRNCSTKVEFLNRLEQFKKLRKNSGYDILYLAFHGSTKTIHFGDETIQLSEIQEILKESLENKIIYFGCCKTLNIKREILEEFVKVTNANCLVGFSKDVDFIEGSVLDLLFFETAQNYKRQKSLKESFEKKYHEISNKYGLQIITN